MKSTTIRVASRTRDRLNALARRRGASAGDVVSELVEHADDIALLDDAVRSWEELACDPQQLATYHDESGTLAGFDATLPEY